MTTAVVQRIVWKEYRTFRGFWISIAVLTLLLQAAAVYLDRSLGWGIWNRVRDTSPLSFMALATTVFYMLGVGATIFSLEHEQSTYPQLRAWPAGFQEVWLGKLLFVLLSSVLLGAFLSLATRCLWGSFDWDVCWILLYLGITVLSVAVLCSLCVSRPLQSTFAAGGAVFLLWSFPQFIILAASPWTNTRTATIAWKVTWIVVGLLGLVVSYPLAGRWFTERTQGRTSARLVPRATMRSREHGHAAKRQLARMMWLSARQLGWIWLGTAAVVGLIYWISWQNRDITFFFLLGFWPPVIGATLFSGDQSQRSYQFFTERSVSDRQLWWQRQAVGLMAFAVGMVLTLPAAIWLQSLVNQGETAAGVPVASCVLTYCVLAYAWGQMVSLSLRSLLLSLTIAFMGIGPLVAWCSFAGWFRLPWWLAAAIPASGLWAASRLRASNWMLDRNRLYYWLAPVAALLTAGVVLLGSYYVYRVYEIPWVERVVNEAQVAPSRSPAEQQAAAEIRQTLSGLERLSRDADSDADPRREARSVADMMLEGIPPLPWSSLPEPISVAETQWLHAHQAMLSDPLLEDLNQLRSIQLVTDVPGAADPWDFLAQLRLLAELYVVQAREDQQSGDLSGALARYQAAMRVWELIGQHAAYKYPQLWFQLADMESDILQSLLFWAADAKQTDSQLQQAIDWSQSWLGKEQEWEPLMMSVIRERRRLFDESLSSDGWRTYRDHLPVTDFVGPFLSFRIPGERQRWQRLLNVLDQTCREDVQRCVSAVRIAQDVEWVMWRSFHGSHWLRAAVVRGGDDRAWNRWNTLDAWATSTPLIVPHIPTWPSASELLISCLERENQRRATHLRLRLIQWRLQHGAYPTRSEWQELVRNLNVSRDAVSGNSFEYLPEGLHNVAVSYLAVPLPFEWLHCDASGQPALARPRLRWSSDAPGSTQSQLGVFVLPPAGVVLRHEQP